MTVTRRQFLNAVAVGLPCASLACRSRELRPDERVCAHVYPQSLTLPASILQNFGPAPSPRPAAGRIPTGLPELFVCRTSIPFLQLFPYFWPIATDELQRARHSIRILFQVARLSTDIDVDGAERWLAGQSFSSGSVGVFTHDDFTRFFARRVLRAFRNAGLAEIVVFKDPSVPPWLCDAPARQKRFRRPPP